MSHPKKLLLWAGKQEAREALTTCLNEEKQTLQTNKNEIKPQELILSPKLSTFLSHSTSQSI